MGRQRHVGSAEPRRPKTAADMARELPAPFKPLSDSPVLIADEQRNLALCEAAIETLKVAFWAAGKALQIIRDARLYRTQFATFDDYCLVRWGMQRRYADRLIQAWPVAEALSPIGLKNLNEAQVRELVPLADKHGEQAAVVVYRTVAEADDVRLTAEVLKGAVAAVADDFSLDTAVEQVRAYLARLGAGPESQDPVPDQSVRGSVDFVSKAAKTMPHSWLRRLAKQDRAAAVGYLDELQQHIDKYRQELARD